MILIPRYVPYYYSIRDLVTFDTSPLHLSLLDLKKLAPYFELMNEKKKSFEHFSDKVILKIFEFSFILDQSQICISNGLGARALQREALFC